MSSSHRARCLDQVASTGWMLTGRERHATGRAHRHSQKVSARSAGARRGRAAALLQRVAPLAPCGADVKKGGKEWKGGKTNGAADAAAADAPLMAEAPVSGSERFVAWP